ncbi:cell division protein FtsQ/DivIB [Ornithinibacillus halophilus]|uniref:Cell division protein DivIB n=1 Tax=Ornithinibacillus halophilus TaxID=930117 RepID=A0A1M5C4K0_9BACI|nr:FtsQ-type POTRA domain-containing protein [Ornithinibacillus halophilus]SHF49556.1 cell division protein FtsQ [Ornithinibacillus halophilus]
MGKEKIVSIEDRIPKLKQARKKKANRRLIFYLSIFFFLVSIIVYLQTPLSHIKTITVNGNSFMSEEQVLTQSEISIGKNIWMVDLEASSNKLTENPIIKKVEVSRNLPWGITIEVLEHEHVAYFERDNQYYPLLSNGTIISTNEISTPDGYAPIMINFTEDEYLYRMTEELNLLSTSILDLISEIHWNPSEGMKNKILLYMNDGFMVEGTIRGFSDKMNVYPSIVSQLEPDSKGIIHIGVGAYFESFDENDMDEEAELDVEAEE